MECPSCHVETPEARFCDGCGAALPARCRACGAVNRAGARFCAECGQSLIVTHEASAKPLPAQHPAPSVERRQLTVVFCDLVGSTPLSTQLDPEDMREIIAAYHRCCAERIIAAGGFVAKYMGDGVLAYFGYPQAHEDDAERAVRAALGITEAVPGLPTTQQAPLQVRVGIATGLVVVGDLVGEGVAQEQGVVGETPNLAARLHALAAPGQVVIAEGTRRLTGGLFEYRDLGRVALKGFVEPVQAWEVIGLSAAESRFEAQHAALLTPLIGREEELELLSRRWRMASSGAGRVVLIVGEPGIGKSRVIAEFRSRLEGEPSPALRFFCSPQHTDSAFYPVISQLERAAGFARHDRTENKLAKLATVLDRTAVAEDDFRLIAELLSIRFDEKGTPISWSAQRRKERTFSALLRQIEILARQHPVLAVYEDVHWIDPSSRELLDVLVDRVAHLPVLLVITCRPEFQSPWTGQAHVSVISLARLDRQEGSALVQRVAGNKALPQALVAEILERTDGVPLFVEEMTKSVLEAESRDERQRIVSAVSLPHLSVPQTLQASLMARLDRLGAAAKEAAQICAVLGREFSYDLLAPVAAKNEGDLQLALKLLGDAGLVFCRGTPPQATFLFKHALVRDAAYSTLLRDRRQQIHSRVAEVLESQFPDVVTGQPELVAYHCAEAGLVDKAIRYRLVAGRQALVRSTMKEALAHVRIGLELIDKLPATSPSRQLEIDFQLVLGRALLTTRGYSVEEAGAAYARAHELCKRLDAPAQLVPVLYGRWVYHLTRGEIAVSQKYAEEVLGLGEERDERAVIWLGCLFIGMCVNDRALVQAREYFERGLSVFDRSLRPAWPGVLENEHVPMRMLLANNLLDLGYPVQALSQRDLALAEARRISHAFTLAQALIFASFDHRLISNADFLTRCDEIVAIADQHGFALYHASATLWRGWALTQLGRGEEGVLMVDRGLGAIRATGMKHTLPQCLAVVAESHLAVGRVGEALEYLSEAVGLVEQMQACRPEPTLYRLRGHVLWQMGKVAAAEQSFLRAIETSRRLGAKFPELLVATSLARLWRDQGKRTEARDLLAPIYGWFTEGFDTPDLKEAKALLDELST